MHQGTQEWLDYRKDKIGASDAASIMGCGYHTPLQLWEIKKGLREVNVTPAMRRGKQLEDTVRCKYESHTNSIMFPAMGEHPDRDWMIASYDGVDDDFTVACEIKCVGLQKQEMARENMIPEVYWPQLQHQLAVSPSLKRVDYVSYYETDDEMIIIQVAPDRDYIEWLMREELKFKEFLDSGTPPGPTDKDKIVRLDDEWLTAERELVTLKLQYEDAKDAYDRARLRMIDLCCDQSSEGTCVSLTRVVSRGRVDYKKIPELKKIDLEKYRGEPTIGWRVSTKSVDYDEMEDGE